MNNILNAQEAFNALRSGKTVLCRHILGEFDSLDQFPATVFALPEHEFCIKIETIELAGITFTKPLTIDEYQDGQDVFVICTYSPSIYVVNFKTNALIESINSGFVQRDAENAKLQLKAISNALGHELNGDVSIIRLGKEPTKPKRQSKKQSESGEIKQQTNQAANDDNSLDDIIGPVAAQSPTSNDVEKKTSTVPFEDIAAAAVTKTQEIDNQIQERQWTRFHNDKPCLDLGDKSQYEIEYADLTAVVIHAQTPDEANSVVVKTQHWTEEQRKPLLSAISKRLCELQEQSKVKSNEPPSLMVLIQNAPDLTALDALEIDVSARHPDIQPRLMGYVKKRRFELEQPTLVSSIDEELP
ncbi:hypothetical protein GWP85_13175 [Acinetobacter beijerinckii]|uniref:hypothetical protein n=1 Tax=Acinetobacter beijerinckii TaxID=262668 RepID=UPI0023DDD378|nr:hypothetical protein [Acinetobacter beijerinckii]MDF2418448.1 hypothetical protein [Acinetobacter beijerinckii]